MALSKMFSDVLFNGGDDDCSPDVEERCTGLERLTTGGSDGVCSKCWSADALGFCISGGVGIMPEVIEAGFLASDNGNNAYNLDIYGERHVNVEYMLTSL